MSCKKKAWLMWGIMIITYMFNTFHAVVMGVIRPSIIREYNLSENEFVLLTNMFSYTYMIMQIPAGILLDKFGARKVACTGNMIAAIGTIIFATGNSYPVLLIGRALIGLGCSGCFLSVLKISSNWFEDKIFCTISGVTTFVGMMGAMAAQAPMAILCNKWKWNYIYGILGGFTIFIVIIIAFVVRDTPEELGLESCQENKNIYENKKEKVSTGKAVLSVLKNPYTWPPFIAYGCYYGAYLILTGYYGSSMLQAIYQYSFVKASGIITFAVIGCAVGSVVIGTISDKLANRRWVQVFTGVLFVMTWLVLLFRIGHSSFVEINIIMFILGFTSCAYAVCWSCVKECNNPEYVGISTAIANMGGYLGSILVPTIVGNIYSVKKNVIGETDAYQVIILATMIVCILGTIAAIFVKETKGENIYHGKE